MILWLVTIREGGDKCSFMTVNYQFATCINVNEGMVHGIPKKIPSEGDVVKVDVGLMHDITWTPLLPFKSPFRSVTKFDSQKS